jgi:hypothetical protein
VGRRPMHTRKGIDMGKMGVGIIGVGAFGELHIQAYKVSNNEDMPHSYFLSELGAGVIGWGLSLVVRSKRSASCCNSAAFNC